MHNKFQILINMAREKYIHPNHMNHIHVAIIFDRYNSNYIHGENYRVENCINKCSLHAEDVAIEKFKQSKKNYKNKKFNMLIIRFSKSGEIGDSKPCNQCINKIIKSGINFKKIYYTTKHKTIKSETLSHLQTSTRCSNGYLYVHHLRKFKY